MLSALLCVAYEPSHVRVPEPRGTRELDLGKSLPDREESKIKLPGLILQGEGEGQGEMT